MKQSEKNIAYRRNECRNLWLEGVAHLRKSMRAVKARAGRKWEPAKGYPALCYSLYNGQVKGGVSRPAAWILLAAIWERDDGGARETVATRLRQGAWKDGATVKSTCCSSRRSAFNSSTHIVTYKSLTLVLEDPTPFSGFCGPAMHIVHTHNMKAKRFLGIFKCKFTRTC